MEGDRQNPSAGNNLESDSRSEQGLWPWALYDWASNAFYTIILTFVFSRYFSESVVQDRVSGTEYWGNIVGVAGVIVAFSAPVVGSIADMAGRRKPWVASFTLLAVFSTAMLWFVRPDPGDFWWAVFWVGFALVTADYAHVFYNAMLPDLARPSKIGRWSGRGWSMGYIGGIVCLLVALFGFVEADPGLWGLDPEQAEPVRATFLMVAVWYLLFALPFFFLTPDRSSTGLSLGQATQAGLGQIRESFARVREYRDIVRFLLARLLYTDGLGAVFAFGGVYAAGTFGLSQTEVLQFAIALNVTAGLGALMFSRVDDALGSRNTILLALTGLALSSVAILLVKSIVLFWIFGMTLGVFVGPLQAASRSYLARVAPQQLRNQMFGLFAFSGKATAFIAPLLVGAVTGLTGSQRWGMSVLLVYFLVGFLIMLTVPSARQNKAVDNT